MTESDQVGDIFPVNCKLLTKEEITCVADKVRAIPDDECYLVLPEVIERILGTEFCANFKDFYTDINEVQFRRDMTFLIRIIGFYGTQQDRKCLVDCGISQFILENCTESEDSDTTSCIVTVLINISCEDNMVHLPSLVKYGLYSKVNELFVKWRSNDDIVVRLLRMIVTIVSHETPADSKDCGESHAEKLVNTLRSSSDIVRDIIKSSTSRSSEVIVLAAILLHKYIEPVKSSELLDILVPINNFTPQEISKLADNIKAIPARASEADVKKQVISKLVKINFIDKFCGLYQENTEEQYRRDLTCIISRVAGLGNSNVRRLLFRKGVTKLLITECELCTDKEIVLNITSTLISVAYHNTNRLYLAKHGAILLIPALIEKWSGEDNVIMCSVLWMLQNMTGNVDDMEQIASVISDQGINIPVLLTDLLNSCSDQLVLENAVKCIENMLNGSMILHEHFSTQHFIDTCFNKLVKSDLLSEENRYRILRSIVLKLTCNNPQLVTKLLVKHVYYLRELSVLGQNGKLSQTAADIINKYFSCVEKKHKCRVISSFVLLNILRFVLLYIVDIVLDIKIGLDSILNNSEHIRYEGYGILVFSIIPLFYINYQSLLRYYATCFRLITVDPVISLQGSSRGQYLKFLVPWKCDSVKNFMMNVITVFQLHPVITAVELARHSSQSLTDLIDKKFHFARFTVQEKILENVPCTLIKIIILYKTFVPEEGLSKNYLTYLSTVYGIVTLTYKLSSFEKLCRAADGKCSTLTGIQTSLVFIANFTAVSSRIMMCMCLILYTLSAYINKTWIFAAGIGLHMIITLIIHSLAYHRRFSVYTYESTQKKFVTWDYLVREGGVVKNSKLVTLGRSALILCLSWSEGFIVNLRHPIDLLSGDIPHTDHLRSPLYFFSIYSLHLLEVISVAVLASIGVLEANHDWIKHLGYVSVALYLISGALFIIYFSVQNPDKKGKPLSMNVNTRFKHMGYTIQVTKSEQYCHVTPKKTMKIKGKKIHSSPDFNFRLQVMKPCLYCVLGVKHEKSESGELNKCSLKGFMRRIKDCFTNKSKRLLYFNDEDSDITDQLRYQNRSEIDWLMKKVTNYNLVHYHLLKAFPDIEDILYDNTDLINTCKELGVFRSILKISDDELSPGVVANCDEVGNKIKTLYDKTDDVSDTLFEEFDKLCEDYFSLQEAAWEEKCLIWCTTAPTKILTKYHPSKWRTPECKKEIRKWIESQKKIKPLSKHATFYIGKTTGQQLWVTRRWRELSNCCHGDTGYQPVEVELGNV